MNIRSKKGTTMVEAAVIFPLVIAAVAAILSIVSNMYLSLSLQTALHMALREQSGERSETVYRMEKTKSCEATQEQIGLRPVLKMEREREYRVGTLFRDRVSKQEQGRYYVIDEAELIRTFSSCGKEPE